MMRRMIIGTLAGLLLLLTGCTAIGPEVDRGPESTLDRVLSEGKVVIGVLGNAPPFAYLDDNNQLVGYDVDIGNLIADDLEVDAEFVVLPDPAARISALVAGDVDVVAGIFTMTPERAKSVSFSTPYGPDSALLVAREDLDIETWADLKGVNCGIPTGSTAEILAERAPDANISRFADQAAIVAAYQAGQIDCSIENDQYFLTELAPLIGDLEGKFRAYQGYLSLGAPRDDLVWLNWLNQFVIFHGGAGDLDSLYQKWFGIPLPDTLPDF